MSYKKYTQKDFEDLKRQHNIMVLVGNGFDIAVLNKFGSGLMEGKTTSYSDFYDYLTYFDKCRDNQLYKRMTEDLKSGKKDWCDFELSIDYLLHSREVNLNDLEGYIDELQERFTEFLNLIVTTDVTINLNQFSKVHKLANRTLSMFFGDLGECACDFRFENKLSRSYDLFNFLFVNFNYTTLLDNYMHLGKEQFDPHMYKNVDRNFKFYPNPNGYLNMFDKGFEISSYVLTNFIHPHGVQTIPRSLIFGTELPEYKKNAQEKRFIKSYWAQDDVLYSSYFDETELYIIYGMSLSKTDSWWLNNIFQSLKKEKAELIIYFYGMNLSIEEIKDKFIKSCNNGINDEECLKKVKERIFVVRFTENDTYFLGLKEIEEEAKGETP